MATAKVARTTPIATQKLTIDFTLRAYVLPSRWSTLTSTCSRIQPTPIIAALHCPRRSPGGPLYVHAVRVFPEAGRAPGRRQDRHHDPRVQLRHGRIRGHPRQLER